VKPGDSEVSEMRILVANVAACEEDSEEGRFFRTVAVEQWRKSFGAVKLPDTELVFRFPRRGLTALEGEMYSHLHHLAGSEIFHAVLQAERDGFDGALIACFHDPMLWDVRQAVDIPVVGFGESSMVLATLMGRKFGVVTISPYSVHDTDENISKYGLTARCAGVRCVYESGDEQERAAADARGAIEAFIIAARELIAVGAEVIIPGCGLMAPVLRFAPGAEAEYPNGLTEVDGVPVADIYASAIKCLETLIALRSAGSCWISRKGLYAPASVRAIESGRMVLDYSGPGFWDC
jgi:allantoin racemase